MAGSVFDPGYVDPTDPRLAKIGALRGLLDISPVGAVDLLHQVVGGQSPMTMPGVISGLLGVPRTPPPGETIAGLLDALRNYGAGVRERVGLLASDPAEFARRGLLDVVPSKAEADAAKARLLGGDVDPRAYDSYVSKIRNLGGFLGSMNVTPPSIRVFAREAPDFKHRLEILPDGNLRLEAPIPTDRAFLRPWVEGELRRLLTPQYDHYFRFTNNADELALARAGLLRPSMNHADKVREAGLSVARGPHYSAFGYKHGYRLKGTRIGTGSDGEPLLDPRQLVLIDQRMRSADQISREGIKGILDILRSRGLPRDYLSRRLEFVQE